MRLWVDTSIWNIDFPMEMTEQPTWEINWNVNLTEASVLEFLGYGIHSGMHL